MADVKQTNEIVALENPAKKCQFNNNSNTTLAYDLSR